MSMQIDGIRTTEGVPQVDSTNRKKKWKLLKRKRVENQSDDTSESKTNRSE